MSRIKHELLSEETGTGVSRLAAVAGVLVVVILSVIAYVPPSGASSAEPSVTKQRERFNLTDYWPLGPKYSYKIPMLSSDFDLSQEEKIYSPPDANGIVKSRETHGDHVYYMYYKVFKSGIYASINAASLSEKKSMFLLPTWAEADQQWRMHSGKNVYEVKLALHGPLEGHRNSSILNTGI